MLKTLKHTCKFSSFERFIWISLTLVSLSYTLDQNEQINDDFQRIENDMKEINDILVIKNKQDNVYVEDRNGIIEYKDTENNRKDEIQNNENNIAKDNVNEYKDTENNRKDEIQNNENSENSRAKDNVNDADNKSEKKRKNEEIVKKYEVTLPELIPDIFSLREPPPEAVKKLLKRIRKRREKLKEECGHKHTVVEKWLGKQLAKVKRNSINKSCLSKTKGDEHATKTRDEKSEFVEKLPREIQQKIEKRGSSRQGKVLREVCLDKKTLESDGSLTMCGECFRQIDLGERTMPRYLNEIECSRKTLLDYYCIYGEGLCVENEMHVTFLYDQYNVGHERLYDWVEYQQPIAVGCSCQIIHGSYFADFL